MRKFMDFLHSIPDVDDLEKVEPSSDIVKSTDAPPQLLELEKERVEIVRLNTNIKNRTILYFIGGVGFSVITLWLLLTEMDIGCVFSSLLSLIVYFIYGFSMLSAKRKLDGELIKKEGEITELTKKLE
jgi:hypothetical protein